MPSATMRSPRDRPSPIVACTTVARPRGGSRRSPTEPTNERSSLIERAGVAASSSREAKPVSKSSTASSTPSRASENSAPSATPSPSKAAVSVISSTSADAGRPVTSSVRWTWSTKRSSRSWNGDTLTLTRRSRVRARRRHRRSCTHARPSTSSPSGTINPDASATATMWVASPRRGSVRDGMRTRASTATGSPPGRRTMGW